MLTVIKFFTYSRAREDNVWPHGGANRPVGPRA